MSIEEICIDARSSPNRNLEALLEVLGNPNYRQSVLYPAMARISMCMRMDLCLQNINSSVIPTCPASVHREFLKEKSKILLENFCLVLS